MLQALNDDGYRCTLLLDEKVDCKSKGLYG